jgi:hypothetical protein
LRINSTALSRAVGVVSISRSSALTLGFQDMFPCWLIHLACAGPPSFSLLSFTLDDQVFCS